jgi:hypothetical protein
MMENWHMIAFSTGSVKISPTFEFEKPIGKYKKSPSLFHHQSPGSAVGSPKALLGKIYQPGKNRVKTHQRPPLELSLLLGPRRPCGRCPHKRDDAGAES